MRDHLFDDLTRDDVVLRGLVRRDERLRLAVDDHFSLPPLGLKMGVIELHVAVNCEKLPCVPAFGSAENRLKAGDIQRRREIWRIRNSRIVALSRGGDVDDFDLSRLLSRLALGSFIVKGFLKWILASLEVVEDVHAL